MELYKNSRLGAALTCSAALLSVILVVNASGILPMRHDLKYRLGHDRKRSLS